MTLTFAKAERLWLKSHASFDESWLQDKIAEDPSILGLGDIELLDRERVQGKAGRLDLLLSDADNDRRYEVELQLGATDPSHIIRTLEYWDIERRRYPAYDHVAVLVAEDITGRFLNVLGLFAGSVPFVAIQLSALQIGDIITLDFVKVLDQTVLRSDDESEGQQAATDRAYWEKKSNPDMVKLADELILLINEKAEPSQRANYRRHIVGLSDGMRTRNFVRFAPRKGYLRTTIELADLDAWATRCNDAGLDCDVKNSRLRLKLRRSDLEAETEFIRELLHQAVADHEAG